MRAARNLKRNGRSLKNIISKSFLLILFYRTKTFWSKFLLVAIIFESSKWFKEREIERERERERERHGRSLKSIISKSFILILFYWTKTFWSKFLLVAIIFESSEGFRERERERHGRSLKNMSSKNFPLDSILLEKNQKNYFQKTFNMRWMRLTKKRDEWGLPKEVIFFRINGKQKTENLLLLLIFDQPATQSDNAINKQKFVEQKISPGITRENFIWQLSITPLKKFWYKRQWKLSPQVQMIYIYIYSASEKRDTWMQGRI